MNTLVTGKQLQKGISVFPEKSYYFRFKMLLLINKITEKHIRQPIIASIESGLR